MSFENSKFNNNEKNSYENNEQNIMNNGKNDDKDKNQDQDNNDNFEDNYRFPKDSSYRCPKDTYRCPEDNYCKSSEDDYRGADSMVFENLFEAENIKRRYLDPFSKKSDIDSNEISSQNQNIETLLSDLDDIKIYETAPIKLKIKEEEIEIEEEIQEEIEESIAKSWNTDFVVGHVIKTHLNCNLIENIIEEILNIFVKQEFIDWYSYNRYNYEGRIFGQEEPSEFKCDIYKYKEENSVLELCRINGNGFLFIEFYQKFVNELTQKIGSEKIINDNNDNNNDNNNNNVNINNKNTFGTSIRSLLSDDDCIEHEGFTNIDIEMKLSKSEALEYIKDATNAMLDGEIWRDYVSKLRYFVNDNNNAKNFAEIENIFDHLLEPIQNKENPVFDCFIIKNLLEIILILIRFTKCNICVNNIEDIKNKWSDFVDHPFGIMQFGPSQQIHRICLKIEDSINKQTLSKILF